MPRIDRRWMFAVAVLALLVAVGDVALGSCSGVLHMAPFALLLSPLLRGRYLGERHLSRAAPCRPRGATAVVVALARTGHHRLARGSALVGSGLARRPPPRSA